MVEVTAQKKVSTLQETPIAISAFNGDDLARQDIEEAQDIQFAIPNAMFTDRGAFNTVRRDGYTENIATGNNIDGRDQYSVRSTTRIHFNDGDNATLTVQYFNEKSDRQSAVKVACKPDPTIGCAVDTGDTIGYPADFASGLGSTLDYFLLDPRTYGIELTYHWE